MAWRSTQEFVGQNVISDSGGLLGGAVGVIGSSIGGLWSAAFGQSNARRAYNMAREWLGQPSMSDYEDYNSKKDSKSGFNKYMLGSSKEPDGPVVSSQRRMAAYMRHVDQLQRDEIKKSKVYIDQSGRYRYVIWGKPYLETILVWCVLFMLATIIGQKFNWVDAGWWTLGASIVAIGILMYTVIWPRITKGVSLPKSFADGDIDTPQILKAFFMEEFESPKALQKAQDNLEVYSQKQREKHARRRDRGKTPLDT